MKAVVSEVALRGDGAVEFHYELGSDSGNGMLLELLSWRTRDEVPAVVPEHAEGGFFVDTPSTDPDSVAASDGFRAASLTESSLLRASLLTYARNIRDDSLKRAINRRLEPLFPPLDGISGVRCSPGSVYFRFRFGDFKGVMVAKNGDLNIEYSDAGTENALHVNRSRSLTADEERFLRPAIVEFVSRLADYQIDLRQAVLGEPGNAGGS